jgi:adenylate cyclase
MVTAIDADQRRAAGTVTMFAEQVAGFSKEELEADDELRADVERIRGGLQALETVNRLKNANAEIERDIAAGIKRLRSELDGKYVFIGFAATATGDIVSTAIDPRTNGVMCHANVLNAFLQNRFITPASSFAEWPMCLLAGALVGWWTAVRSPRFALTATMLLIVGAIALIFHVMFRRFDTWYVATQFAIVPTACWAAVTLFRQLTAERDKRLFRAQLSQYTSPAIAARIAESPEAAEAFKKVQTRDMTCYFSDLAGFTSISEREDAEIVQHVLNVYLERMSATIWARRGLINKFMGDGVMALFNPSVDPLDDHSRVACEASLDTLEALDMLKREMADDPGASVFEQLSMRIGLAAGEVKNGDMGSELKADYTVIGDVVNLAARLEPANKVFGTNLLISGALRDRIGDDYDIRYLAELQVKGKDRTVPVYELIGRKGTMTDDERAYVERFEQGVALYRAQKWDECIVHFTRILARRPDDAGAARYIDACQELKAFPPGDDWNGALELKEK